MFVLHWFVGDWIEFMLICTTRFLGGALWGITHMYTIEVYPTHIRGTGLGLVSMTGRVAGIIVSFIVEDLDLLYILIILLCVNR
eukprot:UN07261